MFAKRVSLIIYSLSKIVLRGGNFQNQVEMLCSAQRKAYDLVTFLFDEPHNARL